MAKPFDYSKWDNIELSDDEEDTHPNIDKESWFRMKHRSRVEREENEDKDKTVIVAEMNKNSQRIKILEHDLSKLNKAAAAADGSDSDDDDLDDKEGIETELRKLKEANAERQTKLDEYEKNKKWNVDNMFQVKEERTIVNKTAGKLGYTESGFAVEKDVPKKEDKKGGDSQKPAAMAGAKKATETSSSAAKVAASKAASATATSTSTPATSAKSSDPESETAVAKVPSVYGAPVVGPEKEEIGAMLTYHQFTEKHADTVEKFMACKTLEDSKKFLLAHGDVLLQENASNYLLLASLEDEMNGLRDKMKLTARQSQLITNIAELSKTVGTHPGNVIQPFFMRLQERVHLLEFLDGVNAFVDKIIKRAVVKKAEIDEERRVQEGAHDLSDVPKEERLGPGGLDPLEVIETLPPTIVEAFESRDVEQLREALMQLDPTDAEYHMKRCVDSGLWVAES